MADSDNVEPDFQISFYDRYDESSNFAEFQYFTE